MARKATVCECCGLGSWNGRVCKGCLKFYGPPAENAMAAAKLAHRCDAAKTWEDVEAILRELCDVIVPDWPGVSLPRLLYGGSVGRQDRAGR